MNTTTNATKPAAKMRWTYFSQCGSFEYREVGKYYSVASVCRALSGDVAARKRGFNWLVYVNGLQDGPVAYCKDSEEAKKAAMALIPVAKAYVEACWVAREQAKLEAARKYKAEAPQRLRDAIFAAIARAEAEGVQDIDDCIADVLAARRYMAAKP